MKPRRFPAGGLPLHLICRPAAGLLAANEPPEEISCRRNRVKIARISLRPSSVGCLFLVGALDSHF